MNLYFIKSLNNRHNDKLTDFHGVRNVIRKRKPKTYKIIEVSIVKKSDSVVVGYIVKSTLQHANDRKMFVKRGGIGPLEEKAGPPRLFNNITEAQAVIRSFKHDNFEILPLVVVTEKQPEDFNRFAYLTKPAEKLLLHPQLEYDEKMIVKNIIDALMKEGI